ncbi:hypothetical protein C3488_03840 [Streptomyces sp. Ru72]|nr:hypothetical protein C3488_03840 [Streptomyces sp. Ru72]
MYKRMLRSALAVAFSAAVVFGAGAGTAQAVGVAKLDTGWGASEPTGAVATPADTGWGASAPLAAPRTTS